MLNKIVKASLRLLVACLMLLGSGSCQGGSSEKAVEGLATTVADDHQTNPTLVGVTDKDITYRGSFGGLSASPPDPQWTMLAWEREQIAATDLVTARDRYFANMMNGVDWRAAHVMLSYITGQLDLGEPDRTDSALFFNGMEIHLYNDGTVEVPEAQQPLLAERWKTSFGG